MLETECAILAHLAQPLRLGAALYALICERLPKTEMLDGRGSGARQFGVTPEAGPVVAASGFEKWSQFSDSNRGPTVYKTVALPLS